MTDEQHHPDPMVRLLAKADAEIDLLREQLAGAEAGRDWRQGHVDHFKAEALRLRGLVEAWRPWLQSEAGLPMDHLVCGPNMNRRDAARAALAMETAVPLPPGLQPITLTPEEAD